MVEVRYSVLKILLKKEVKRGHRQQNKGVISNIMALQVLGVLEV
jgi:hypothetical protein